MLCHTCLGVLQECRNYIVDRDFLYSSPGGDGDRDNNSYCNSSSSFDDDTRDNVEHDMHEANSDDAAAGAADETRGYARSRVLNEEATTKADMTAVLDVPPDIADTCNNDNSHSYTNKAENILLRIGSTNDNEGEKYESEDTDASCPVDSPVTSSKDISIDGDANTRIRYATYGHHAKVADLEAAAKSGCQVCWQVHSSVLSRNEHPILVSAPVKERFMEPYTAQFSTFAEVWAPLGSARFKIYFRCPGRFEMAGKFSIYSETNIWSTLPRNPVCSDSTSSCESLQIARQWLHDCVNNHAPCQTEMQDSHWYPTRLLDLGDLTREELAHVRVISVKAHDLEGPYMTLSHRWGDREVLQLRRHNFDHFHRTVPIAELPQTFRDAMLFSRGLGIRYLWIDSLCIMQDDRSDWAAEASQMHRIYLNSYCNLYASHAEDNGLFQHRNARTLCATEIDLCMNDQYTDDVREKRVMINEWLFYENFLRSPLSKRGWVFQERLLAPRVIHFCRDQLFWECRNHVACEQYQDGLPSRFYRPLGAALKADEVESSQSAATWYRSWERLVMVYSETSLTYPSDKLVALSGVAKLIRSVVPDEYIAGMWRKDLDRQLLWKAPFSGIRPTVYRAPSWSWASIDGLILNVADEDPVQLLDFEILNIQIEYATVDETGEIKSAWLDVRGKLLPIQLELFSDEVPHWSIIFGHSPENGEIRLLKSSISLQLDDSSLDTKVILQQSAAAQHFCLVASAPVSNDSGNGEQSSGEIPRIILLRLVDAEMGVYERIGLAMVQAERDVKELKERYEEEVKTIFPCLKFEDGKHTIRII